MTNVTIAVSTELKRRMDAQETTNWSAVARKAFEEQLSDIAFIKEFKKKSTLTQADAIRMGREVNQRLADRYRKITPKSTSTKKKG